ncbi:grpE protein homolog 1, mitochondrial-like [Octopus sinensis]|uniref:GrpE protein homolog 1, mitochondrial-like n=1 Tax=Octopus sinensis TaxID=2607531 RepID=A0A7E6EJ11_9MOLL|nr:grpE protein homolog 1, mitochondrial-like [Octopus sinensis]
MWISLLRHSTLSRHVRLLNGQRDYLGIRHFCTPNEPTDPLEQIKEENSKLKESLEELKVGHPLQWQDKYIRSLAEQENMRKRLVKQIEESKIFAIQKFSHDLLEVTDVLQKALLSVPQSSLPDNLHLKNLFEGLEMSSEQFKHILSRHGVVSMDTAVGDKFDPSLHFAQYQVPITEDQEDGTVAEVAKVGYLLHSRTLRPAVVGVFKNI